MMFPGFGYMPDFMSWMMAGSFVFWALVVVLAFVVVLRLIRTPDSRDDPRAILAERFARGEIDDAEYRAKLSVLSA